MAMDKRKATRGRFLETLKTETAARRRKGGARSTVKKRHSGVDLDAPKKPGRGPRLTIYLEPDLHAELLQYVHGRKAKGDSVSYSDVVSEALERFLRGR